MLSRHHEGEGGKDPPIAAAGPGGAYQVEVKPLAQRTKMGPDQNDTLYSPLQEGTGRGSKGQEIWSKVLL